MFNPTLNVDHQTPGNLNNNMEGGVWSFVGDVMERGDWPRGIFQENLERKTYVSVFLEASHSRYTKSPSHLVWASASLASLLCSVLLHRHLWTATQVNWPEEKLFLRSKLTKVQIMFTENGFTSTMDILKVVWPNHKIFRGKWDFSLTSMLYASLL